MSRLGLLLVALIWGLTGSSIARAQDSGAEFTPRSLDRLLIRAQVGGVRGEFQAHIYGPSEDNYDGWLLEIRCTSCEGNIVVYREIVDDPPIAAFVLGDQRGHLLTTWAQGASRYSARVYYIDVAETRRVLFEVANAWPEFKASNKDGTPEVTITTWQSPTSERSLTWRKVWRWDGKEYKSSGRRCVANCDNDNRVR